MLRSITYSISIAIIFALSTPAPAAQTQASTIISARELQADFEILKKAYEELHPGLYRYNTKSQMEFHFEALKNELNRDLTLQQAYLAFSVFLAKIKCGHSYANFFNQPRQTADALFKRDDKVPFHFRWINGRMIVTRDLSSAQHLKPGTEILTINGTPVKTILKRLLAVARADGTNDAKRISYLELSGESEYEAFNVYFPMLFPQTYNQIELRVKEPLAAKSKELQVQALTHDQWLAPIKTRIEARRGAAQVWDFKFLDKNTAYLRMPTWALFNSKWDWKQFLQATFDQLVENKPANLIIDLRGNEGGLGVGDVILSRLIKRDLQIEGFKRLVRYRKVSPDLAPYLDTWDKSFLDWGEAATDFNNGFYALKRKNDKDGDIIKASDRPFEGRVFVLIDASNSSATFEFAQALQQNRLATLVGQPTGGNQRGINGGAFFFLRLPNSKIEIDIPLIGYFPPGPRPDAGLQPDIAIEPKVADIARGIDTELNVLRQRLQSRK